MVATSSSQDRDKEAHKRKKPLEQEDHPKESSDTCPPACSITAPSPPYRKLAAAILGGVDQIHIKPGAKANCIDSTASAASLERKGFQARDQILGDKCIFLSSTNEDSFMQMRFHHHILPQLVSPFPSPTTTPVATRLETSTTSSSSSASAPKAVTTTSASSATTTTTTVTKTPRPPKPPPRGLKPGFMARAQLPGSGLCGIPDYTSPVLLHVDEKKRGIKGLSGTLCKANLQGHAAQWEVQVSGTHPTLVLVECLLQGSHLLRSKMSKTALHSLGGLLNWLQRAARRRPQVLGGAHCMWDQINQIAVLGNGASRLVMAGKHHSPIVIDANRLYGIIRDPQKGTMQFKMKKGSQQHTKTPMITDRVFRTLVSLLKDILKELSGWEHSTGFPLPVVVWQFLAWTAALSKAEMRRICFWAIL
ncbi:hypothetical protein GH733_005039 [Mirounga leonina]|nr:hypothetical protein GH733_005039 [Mirounga leonina]